MRYVWRLVIVTALVLGSAASAQGTTRVALVIGNGAYQSVPALKNPPRDAALVADALRRSGFSVSPIASDLGKPAFEAALRDFKRQADAADIALIYYAGHGIELEEQNWLLPVDAKILDPADAHTEGVSLSTLLRYVAGARRARIVVLDACRDNPFAMRLQSQTRSVTRGLRPVEGLPPGTLVAYSASSGQVASEGEGQANSPFATALARRIQEPGLEVRFLFARVRDDVIAANAASTVAAIRNQRPWIGAELSAEEIYFVSPRPLAFTQPPVTTIKVLGADVQVSELGAEVEAFDAAAKANSAQQWRAFIQRFPNGRLKGVAELSLASLTRAAPPSTDPLTSARAALAAITTQEWNVSEDPLVIRAVAASSREALTSLAVAGHRRAQVLVAGGYRAGLAGFSTNLPEAARYFRMAAAQGDPAGQAGLGIMYDFGEGGLPQDKAEAVNLYRLAAAQGNARGQVNLGLRYLHGKNGLPLDKTEAARLFRLAANQGSALGQTLLGDLYYEGVGGLARSPIDAAQFYRLAAAQGDARGQNQLGVMYSKGEGGLALNTPEAARLFKLAASQGYAESWYRLGTLYYNGGNAILQDVPEAARHFKRAADLGDANGQVALGILYERGEGGLPQNKVESARLYALASAQENASARVKLAFFYYRGEGGLPQDRQEAIRLFRAAAQQGDANAQQVLRTLGQTW